MGKNATLIVPCPSILCSEGYQHLGQFIRNAPSEQWNALWTSIGENIQAQINEQTAPIWLSTSGLGVHWLHVRLDQRPKYYLHKTYKTLN